MIQGMVTRPSTQPEAALSQPVLECVNPWETACLCGAKHMPCWPRPDTACCDRLEPENPTPEQTAQIERMLHVATEIIWRLSGKQFGACPVTVRPCKQACAGSQAYGYWSGALWTPVIEDGVWFNQACDRCPNNASSCGCSELCEIDLIGPVAEILEVKVDGEVLPTSQYRVDDHRKLVRTAQFVPLPGPTSFSSVQTPPSDTNVWCNPSPAPSSTPGFDPPVDGCYTPNVSNPTFYWANEAVTEVSYVPTDNRTVTTAFYNGLYPSDITGSYNFDAYNDAGAITTGMTVVSSQTGNAFLRITVLAGSMERYTQTPYGWTISPNTRLRFERLTEEYGGCWPKCQDLGKPDTEDGTFSVRYRRGQAVPQGGLWAAGLLACELLKACDGDAECQLPTNAQRISRQGVTVELTPVLIKAGEFNTGIQAVDLWLQSVNPYKSKAPSRVYSIDRPRPRTTTWPCND